MAIDGQERVWAALDGFKIEVPSWGFANTGTRFGKFLQAAAATNISEKFADAAEVNRLTGAAPTIALHVLWDLPGGLKDVAAIKGLEETHGVRSGSINPNLFQEPGVQVWVDCESGRGGEGQGVGTSAGFGGDREGAWVKGCFDLGCGWVELSRDAEHSAAESSG